MTTPPNPADPPSRRPEGNEELSTLRRLLGQQEAWQRQQEQVWQRQQEELRRQQAEAQRQQEAWQRQQERDWYQQQAQIRRQQQAHRSYPQAAPAAPAASGRRKDTAIVRGATVDDVAVRVLRFGAIALLVVSFLGSVVAINGGWAPIIAAWPAPWQGISLLAAIVGVGLQIWITLIEWYQRQRKTSLLYLSHASVDVVFTYMGYAPILAPFFTGGLTRMGLVQWLATFIDQEPALALVALLSNAVVGILAIIVAVLPEQMLVD